MDSHVQEGFGHVLDDKEVARMICSKLVAWMLSPMSITQPSELKRRAEFCASTMRLLNIPGVECTGQLFWFEHWCRDAVEFYKDVIEFHETISSLEAQGGSMQMARQQIYPTACVDLNC